MAVSLVPPSAPVHVDREGVLIIPRTSCCAAWVAVGFGGTFRLPAPRSPANCIGCWTCREAETRGSTDAAFYLGRAYAVGGAVKVDKQRAVNYLRVSSDAGNPLAQFMLADAYLQGEGVEEDEDEAIRLLKKSADGGFEQAGTLLSEIDGDVSYAKRPIGQGKVRL